MADDQGPFMPPGSLPTQQQGPVQDTPPPQTTPDNVGGNIPQQASPQAPNVAVQQSPQQKNLLHSAALGQGWKSIMGTLGGAGGAQNFFKGLLTSAIVGAAAGANNNTGSGLKSAAMGAGATLEDQRAQQQLAQQRQQQQFQNQMAQSREARESQAAMSEEQLRKAQIASANMETLKTNQMIQGQSFKMHQDMADADKARVASYTASGLQPVTPEPLSESEMADYIKNRPGATSLDWRNVGTKTVDGPNGPTFESTFQAYDPKGPITVSPATKEQWKKDGLFDYFPEAKEMLDKKPTLDFGTFNRLDQQAQMYNGQKVAKTLQDQNSAEGAAKIKLTLAETAKDQAEAMHARAEASIAGEAKNKANLQSEALAEYSKVGGDMSKVSAGHQLVIRQYADEEAKDILNAIKENGQAAQLGDPAAKAREQELWGSYHQLSQLGSLASKAPSRNQGPTGPMVSVTTKDGKIGQIPKANLADFLKANPGASSNVKTVPIKLAGSTQQVPEDEVQDFLSKYPQAQVSNTELNTGFRGPNGVVLQR